VRRRAQLRGVVIWTPLVLMAIVAAHVVRGWVGGVAGVVASALVMCVLLALLRFAMIRYWVPRRYRALVSAQITPDARPPADALPVASDLAQHWAQAVTQRDWRAARRLVEDDMVVETSSSERPFSRRLHFRGLRIITTAFPDLRVSVDEVLGRPAEPDVIWVRLTQAGRPRRGPALHITGWERWTLDRTSRRVRVVRSVGVTQVR
jgi:hypothetical protein